MVILCFNHLDIHCLLHSGAQVPPSIRIIAHHPPRDSGPHAEPGSKGNVEELGKWVCVSFEGWSGVAQHNPEGWGHLRAE